MVRRLAILQDKGGSGKTTIVRAAAELEPDAIILEMENSPRLIELGARVRHCAVRIMPEELRRRGAAAARAEFDGVLKDLFDEAIPRVIIDAGANCGEALCDTLAGHAEYLTDAGIEIGVVVPVTAEPGALAGAATLLAKAPSFAVKTFVIANAMYGPVNLDFLKRLEPPTICSNFPMHDLEDEARKLLIDGGLAPIRGLENREVRRRFIDRYGPGPGIRICQDLLRFRVAAMAAVEDAVLWLGGQ